MEIDTSVNGWEKQLLAEEMKIVQQAMEDEFYDVFLKSYQEYVDKFYQEYPNPKYVRTKQLRNVLPVELKPIIKGDSIECGIDLEQFNRVHYEEQDKIDEILKGVLLHGSHGGYIETETAPYVDMKDDLENNYMTTLAYFWNTPDENVVY